MRRKGTTARRGMMTYVTALLILGCIIAGAYLVIGHPGDTHQPSVAAQAQKTVKGS